MKNVLKKLISVLLLSSLFVSMAACGEGAGDPANDKGQTDMSAKAKESDLKIERKRLFSGFDGQTSKNGGSVCTDYNNLWISWGLMDVNDSDVAGDFQVSKSSDDGISFSAPETRSPYGYHEGNVNYTYGGCVDCYSIKYRKFLSLGIMCQTRDGANAPLNSREACYILRDRDTYEYVGTPKTLPFPYDSPSICPNGNPIEFENGDLLFTFYYTEDDPDGKYRLIAVRYSFDGENLSIAEAGTPIANDSLAGGFAEPSVAKSGDKYYMTIRSQENAYLAVSGDGLNYGEPVLWRFDDGNIIGSRRTQQRWVRHKNGLFLVYTRDNGHNDHVFRNRAPLYIAQFDEESECLMKDTEQVLVPELGADIGNFAICEVSDNVSYVVTTEWMGAYGRNKPSNYGCDGSVWVVKVTSEAHHSFYL